MARIAPPEMKHGANLLMQIKWLTDKDIQRAMSNSKEGLKRSAVAILNLGTMMYVCRPADATTYLLKF